ncbi:hypothetical protein [Okeania sp. SIO2C2]|uniref:hypothetical protein n=1 Tax=Okeania sp. SIO2C2 TaxID=2607787 RepID=UPI00257DC1BC|nr:hypothetical protein [Okeania sp. SIO2C2]
MALNAGVKPSEICAYVQDDNLGMGGLKALRQAVAQAQVEEKILRVYDQVLEYKEKGNQDNPLLSPVGFYPRNTLYVREGYNSLKQWKKNTKINFRLVVTAGTSANITRFIKLAQYKGEDWAILSLSSGHIEELQFDSAYLRAHSLSWSIGYGEVSSPSHPTGSCANDRWRLSPTRGRTAFALCLPSTKI